MKYFYENRQIPLYNSQPWESSFVIILQEERKMRKMHENSHPGEVCRRCGTGGGSQEQRQVALQHNDIKKSKLGGPATK